MLTILLAAMLGSNQPDVDCAHATTQADMNYCADDEYHRADLDLNRLWPPALQRARELDGQVGGGHVAETRLRAAQRAWIAFRDAQCEVAGLDALGGSLEPLLVSSCLRDMTRRRAGELGLLLQPR